MIPANHSSCWEIEPILIRRQVYMNSGSLALSTDVSSILLKVFDLGATEDETTEVYSTSLSVASTVITVTTTGWTQDDVGYNVTTTIAPEAFTKYGGHVYQAVIALTTTADGVKAVVENVAVLGIGGNTDGAFTGESLLQSYVTKLNSVDFGARACQDNPLMLASVRGVPASGTDDPSPITGTGSYQECAQWFIDAPLWRDSGYLRILAVFEFSYTGSNTLIPMFQIETATDFSYGAGLNAATRGQIPTWSSAGTLTPATITTGVTPTTKKYVLDLLIMQGLRSGATFEQTWVAECAWDDVVFLGSSPSHVITTSAIDCSVDRLFRLNFKFTQGGSGGTFKFHSADVMLFNPRNIGPTR